MEKILKAIYMETENWGIDEQMEDKQMIDAGGTELVQIP